MKPFLSAIVVAGVLALLMRDQWSYIPTDLGLRVTFIACGSATIGLVFGWLLCWHFRVPKN